MGRYFKLPQEVVHLFGCPVRAREVQFAPALENHQNAHFLPESSKLAIPVGTGECIQMNTKVTGKHGDTSGKTPGGTCDTTSTFRQPSGRPPIGLKFSSFWLVLSNYFFTM